MWLPNCPWACALWATCIFSSVTPGGSGEAIGVRFIESQRSPRTPSPRTPSALPLSSVKPLTGRSGFFNCRTAALSGGARMGTGLFLRQLVLESTFDFFTTQPGFSLCQYHGIDDLITLQLRGDKRDFCELIVTKFDPSAVCKCFNPLFVWHFIPPEERPSPYTRRPLNTIASEGSSRGARQEVESKPLSCV